MSPTRGALLAVCGACVMPLAAGAQPRRVIQGVVLDGSNQPVPMAAVLAPRIDAAITDDSGRFRVTIPHNNAVVLDVRRVGFMQSRITLKAGGDTTLSLLLVFWPLISKLIDVARGRRGATHDKE